MRRSLWKTEEDKRTVEYEWKKNGYWSKFKIEAEVASSEIVANSATEFITEHYWGYAKINDQATNEYEVTHPKWKKYTVKNYEIDVDFKTVYGQEFEFLNNGEPDSVMLAEGSEITVEKASKIQP